MSFCVSVCLYLCISVCVCVCVLVHQVDPPADAGGTITKDRFDVKWPYDKLCVTSECVQNTLQEYTSQSIREASDGAVPIDMSFQTFMSLLYLLPLFAALVGVAGAVGVCGKQTTWQYWPACISTTCMCLLTPFVFLIAGMLFTGVMFASDGCASAPNLVHEYVKGSLPDFCDSLSGTLLANDMCRFKADVGLPSNRTLDFQVQLPDVVASVLGSCPATLADDPLAAVFNSVRSALGGLAVEELDDAMAKRDGKDWALRTPLKDVLRGGGAAVDTSVQSFVTDMQGVIGCSGLNAAIANTKDSTCCDVMDAVYWSIASWYLIAWSMLICGIPAGILGCKRFPTAVWGHAARAEADKLRREELAAKQGSSKMYAPPPGGGGGGGGGGDGGGSHGGGPPNLGAFAAAASPPPYATTNPLLVPPAAAAPAQAVPVPAPVAQEWQGLSSYANPMAPARAAGFGHPAGVHAPPGSVEMVPTFSMPAQAQVAQLPPPPARMQQRQGFRPTVTR